MKSGKKTVLKIILGMVAVFSLLNVSWYIWRMVKYDAYSKDMEKNVFVNFGLKPHDLYNFRWKNCKNRARTARSLQFRASGPTALKAGCTRSMPGKNWKKPHNSNSKK